MQILDTLRINAGGGFKVPAVAGTGLKDAQGIARHIGVDLYALIGSKVHTIWDGVVTESDTNATSGNQIIELRVQINGVAYLVRFLHLSGRHFSKGQTVTAGQEIALSGNSGGVSAHLHIDIRRDGTTWSASLNNYIDPTPLVMATNNVLESRDMKADIGYVKQVLETVGGQIGAASHSGPTDAAAQKLVGADAGQVFSTIYFSPEATAWREELRKAYQFYIDNKDKPATVSTDVASKAIAALKEALK